MAEKISTLVLKVDLNCPQCYKKIKKVLCKYHCEIRSQTFDKKQNTVTISGRFDPDCFSRRLCCKAGKSIKSIEIIKEKPTPPPPPPPATTTNEKPIEVPKPDPPPPKAPEPKPAPAPPPKAPEPAPEPPKAKEETPKEPAPAPPKAPEPPPKPEPKIVIVEPVFSVPGYPPNFGVCCGPCYQGHGGGPCHQGYGGYGRPPPPPPTCFDGPPTGYHNYDGYYYSNGRTKCYVNCDYFSEENPTSCTIM